MSQIKQKMVVRANAYIESEYKGDNGTDAFSVLINAAMMGVSTYWRTRANKFAVILQKSLLSVRWKNYSNISRTIRTSIGDRLTNPEPNE